MRILSSSSSSLGSVDADAWDNLVGDDDPFVEHAFLSLLEKSGSV
ncbi:MAG: N-acetyltransferase, partial [Deltaproteobacteria bacterium]|nr:N-acetyltransferase [Deltaproteobacteria bacterium]